MKNQKGYINLNLPVIMFWSAVIGWAVIELVLWVVSMIPIKIVFGN